MKYLVIFFVLLAIVAAYLYWRLRPYIRVARQFFGVAREAQRSVGYPTQDKSFHPAASRAGEKLIRCDSCATWHPSSRVLRVGKNGAQFCSPECLERAANSPAPSRRSAS